MIIYNVLVTISRDIESDWIKWMKEIHIPDVLSTGYFFNFQIQKQILPESEQGQATYSINYFSKSYRDYLDYTEKEAPRLQKLHFDQFSGKFKATRNVFEVI